MTSSEERMQNSPPEAPTGKPPETTTPKKRHGCLTAWLILIIAFSSITLLSNLIENKIFIANLSIGNWAPIVFILIYIWNIICVIALLKWKKWGFWGICSGAIITLITNIVFGISYDFIYRVGYIIWATISAVVGIVILWIMLNIGGKDKAWTQLE
jgi:hypothetical protein